jgi:GTP-binding protein EngB required for normal cell division
MNINQKEEISKIKKKGTKMRTTRNSSGSTICLIGSTGVGKSSFANKLGNLNDKDKSAFKVASTASSVTETTSIKSMTWFDGSKVTVIDTPGLNDSEGRDTKHIANMVETLKSHKHVNLFALVFNGKVPRFDDSMKAMIKIFKEMFGPDFLKNACLVFTNWPMHEYAIDERNISDDTEEKKRKEFNEIFKGDFDLEQELPCFFIDNAYDVNKEKSARLYQDTLQGVKDLSDKMEPFPCLDIQAVLTETEKKKEELRKAKEQARKDRVAAEAQAQLGAAEAQLGAAEAQLRKAEEKARKAQEEADAHKGAGFRECGSESTYLAKMIVNAILQNQTSSNTGGGYNYNQVAFDETSYCTSSPSREYECRPARTNGIVGVCKSTGKPCKKCLRGKCENAGKGMPGHVQ